MTQREDEVLASPLLTAADYMLAGRRANTERSYAEGVRHFEEMWGGLLPATPARVTAYLAHYAPTLAHNTLRNRLAALAKWHSAHGFTDPTRDPAVRATLKGIRSVHHTRERRAAPMQLRDLEAVDRWAAAAIAQADANGDRSMSLRARRDRALILLGFWRGFRSDELLRLRLEDITVVPGQGMRLYLPRSKGDRQAAGVVHTLPALSRLCGVAAVQDWSAVACLAEGPLFRAIDRYGSVRPGALHPNSVIGVLRRAFLAAAVPNAGQFSSHSLRRGFAGWAATNGWDARVLMEYVGWKDIHTAMRYVDGSEGFEAERFEQGLGHLLTSGISANET